jgi:hypothetical protein
MGHILMKKVKFEETNQGGHGRSMEDHGKCMIATANNEGG